MDQADFSDGKTHIMEHHWLQNNNHAECNGCFAGGDYNGCEPYYFNHGPLESAPMASFYDGHVEKVSNAEVNEFHSRRLDQVGYGVWVDNPGGASDGYYNDCSYVIFENFPPPDYHVYTVDGIKGMEIEGN